MEIGCKKRADVGSAGGGLLAMREGKESTSHIFDCYFGREEGTSVELGEGSGDHAPRFAVRFWASRTCPYREFRMGKRRA